MAQHLQILMLPTYMNFPSEPKVWWANWIAQLHNFFTLTDITLGAEHKLADATKNAYSSTLIGTKGLCILMANPVGTTTATATYTEFCRDVQVLFECPVNPVRAEYDFHSRHQGACESISDYLTTLRTLLLDCDTLDLESADAKELEDHKLAMQLAISCYNQQTLEKLLKEKQVDLNNFIEIIQADELATQLVMVLRNETAPGSTTVATNFKALVHPQHSHDKSSFQQAHKQHLSNNSKACYGCGGHSHHFKSVQCPATGKMCSHCGKANHFAKVCLQKAKETKAHASTLRFLQLGKIGPQHNMPPVKINLLLRCSTSTATIEFMVDSGADVSTICHSMVQKHFPHSRLLGTPAVICNFDGSTIRGISGTLHMSVRHKDRTCLADMVVIPDSLHTVVGHDIIQELGLVIDGATHQVCSTTMTPAPAVELPKASQYPSLLSNSLSMYPNYEHVITVNEQFQPHVTKVWVVPWVIDSGI